MHLRLARRQLACSQPQLPWIGATRSARTPAKGAKALIIDDSPTVVAVLRKILRSAGYTTSEAGDAESGLMLMQQDVPDLVFLDIILPGMNGFRCLARHPQGSGYAARSRHHDQRQRARHRTVLRQPHRGGRFHEETVFAIRGCLLASRLCSMPTAPGAKPILQPHQLRLQLRLRCGTAICLSTRYGGAGYRYQRRAGPRPGAWSALDARKELTAMGLQYFDQNQFFAAIRRGDQLAVELYVAAGGVALDEPLNGQTARDLATAMGRTALAQLLTAAARARTPGSP